MRWRREQRAMPMAARRPVASVARQPVVPRGKFVTPMLIPMFAPVPMELPLAGQHVVLQTKHATTGLVLITTSVIPLPVQQVVARTMFANNPAPMPTAVFMGRHVMFAKSTNPVWRGGARPSLVIKPHQCVNAMSFPTELASWKI